MHTTSSVDNIDEYLETITKKPDGSYTYKVGGEEKPLVAKKIVVPYKSASGMTQREFTTYRTHRGPVVRSVDGKWVSIRLMEEPMKALTQSYSRTKAQSLDDYKKVMDIHTNSSNNTLYANTNGDIAYFHSNFIPKRDDSFDWTKPVDGANPKTEWNGVLSFDESPNVVNPKNGWVYNSNNYPFSAAGANSPKQKDFPKYVDAGSENPRGVHAVRVLDGKKGFTLETLITNVAFDSYMPEFDIQIPLLLKAHASAPASNPLKAKTADAIAALKDWDYRWSAASVPTSVAIFYGEDLWTRVQGDARKAGVSVYEFMKSKATPQQRLESLAAAVDKLAADFGKWQTPWGEINRFQRNDAAIVQKFDDSKPSTPVMFASARWGSLASFGARAVSRDEEVVRHERQQLRCRDRVRRSHPRQGRHGRRTEQRAGIEAFQRSGRALRDRQSSRCLFLSRRLEGSHRARISPGTIEDARHRTLRRQDHAAERRHDR